MTIVSSMPDGRPIYQDAYNRLYVVINNNYVEIDQYGNIIQQNNNQIASGYINGQQQQNNYPINQQQGIYPINQQQGNQNIIIPPMKTNGSTSITGAVSGKYNKKYEDSVKKEINQTQTRKEPVETQISSTPTVISLSGWNNNFDGILIPLIDESREEIDIVFNESNKTFKILVKDK